MVVDTSALLAVLLGEPSAAAIDAALASAGETVISAANLVELMIVVESRVGAAGVLIAEELLERMEIDVVGVTEELAATAIQAWRRYGKGRHRAALNFGDCFAYALAVARDEPLLFVGDDFGLTDVKSALAG